MNILRKKLNLILVESMGWDILGVYCGWMDGWICTMVHSLYKPL